MHYQKIKGIYTILFHFGKDKTIGTENKSVVDKGWGKVIDCKDAWGKFEMMEVFYILIVEVVTWLYIIVKSHRTVYVKGGGDSTIYKLFLSKPDWKIKEDLKIIIYDTLW